MADVKGDLRGYFLEPAGGEVVPKSYGALQNSDWNLPYLSVLRDSIVLFSANMVRLTLWLYVLMLTRDFNLLVR